jgi:hypothetical protein
MVKISFFNDPELFTIALIGLTPILNNAFTRKRTAREKSRPAECILHCIRRIKSG